MTPMIFLTAGTRFIAPPMPLIILPGIIQLAMSPFAATSIAPSTVRTICSPWIMAKLSAMENHTGEDKRRDACADPQRLQHGISIETGACAVGELALQDKRNSATELDDFKAALNVALGAGDHFPMFGTEQVRQLVHIPLDQRLEVEHDACAALRDDRRPSRLSLLRRFDSRIQQGGVGKRDTRLNAAIRVELVAISLRSAVIGKLQLVSNLAHQNLSLDCAVAWPNVIMHSMAHFSRFYLHFQGKPTFDWDELRLLILRK